jgi:glutamyl-tRNA reductase
MKKLLIVFMHVQCPSSITKKLEALNKVWVLDVENVSSAVQSNVRTETKSPTKRGCIAATPFCVVKNRPQCNSS